MKLKATLSIFTLLLSISFAAFTFNDSAEDSDLNNMQTVAEKVLDNLKRAKGILPTEPPSLIVKQFTGGTKLAYLDLKKQEIHLDIASYRICRNMGVDSLNALAYILGHELGHFINGHSVINHNIEEAAPTDMQTNQIDVLVSQVDTVEGLADFRVKLQKALKDFRDTHDEAEADFEGGFLGYLAGYDPTGPGKEFLRRAYSSRRIRLNDVNPGYPTKTERLAIVERTGRELAELTPLFEMSKYLTALGQYEDAIPYLEKITEKFESREIYNNIGVLTVLSTLKLLKSPPSKYQFPLLLDANFRSPHPQYFEDIVSGGMDFDFGKLLTTPFCQKDYLQDQLDVAIEYFNKAIFLDRKYATAFLNLSIAETIQGLLYNSFDCRRERQNAIALAKGHILQAADLARESISSQYVEFFNIRPSEHNLLVSYPIGDVRLLELPQEFMQSEDSLGNITITEFNSHYPYLKEVFGVGQFYKWQAELDTFTTRHTRWNGDDNNPVPEGAYLLSQVLTHNDIIRAIQGEFSAMTDPGMMYSKAAPFYRALELDPNNTLAITNRNIHFQIPEIMTLEFQDYCIPDTKKYFENIGSEERQELANQVLRPSRIMAFYESTIGIMDTDIDLLQYTRSDVAQNFDFYESNDYRVYQNRSHLPRDDRKENATIVIPKTFTGSNGVCEIGIGTGLETLKEKMGSPVRTVSLTNGSVHMYSTGLSYQRLKLPFSQFLDAANNEMYFTYEDPQTVPDSLLIKYPVSDLVTFDGQQYGVLEGGTSTFRKNRIDATRLIDEGVIFETGVDNKVKGWAFYKKEVSTKLELL